MKTRSVAIYVSELLDETIPDAFVLIADDCDDFPIWSYEDSPASVNVSSQLALATDQIATERVFTLTDDCGNQSFYTQYIISTIFVYGCTDINACNYNLMLILIVVTVNSVYVKLMHADADINACNYDDLAIYDDGSCDFPELGFDCEGICFDFNSNDICDISETGCTDVLACNYNASAYFDDGSCDYCNCELEPSVTSTNSEYSIDIELITTHDSGDLAGLSTYRIYITTPNNNDIVSVVTVMMYFHYL